MRILWDSWIFKGFSKDYPQDFSGFLGIFMDSPEDSSGFSDSRRIFHRILQDFLGFFGILLNSWILKGFCWIIKGFFRIPWEF